MSYFSGFVFLAALVFGATRNPEISRWTFYSRAIPAAAILTQPIENVARVGPPIRAAVLLALAGVVLMTLLRLLFKRSRAEAPPVY